MLDWMRVAEESRILEERLEAESSEFEFQEVGIPDSEISPGLVFYGWIE